MPATPTHAIVTARDEAQRLPATLVALTRTFPGIALVVADDGSRDATADLARAAGAAVVATARRTGKGGAATLAARHVLGELPAGEREDAIVVICDGDLAESAGRLGPLVEAVSRGDGDLAVAAFERREGGGVGAAVGFARWALRRRTGLELEAPISGQRALRGGTLQRMLPFAPRFGMEMAMTIDAVDAGYRLVEVRVDLDHRATGRTAAGFLHRGRQLVDFALAYRRRRRPATSSS